MHSVIVLCLFFEEQSGHKVAQSIQRILLNLLSSFNFESWSYCILQHFQSLVGGSGNVTELSCGKTRPREVRYGGTKEGDHLFPH